ncbi:MAG TPA: hypothetical protein PLE14_04885 [Anaerolineales bacterium]|nr:hypothetical protein [Anaerolineales bacterium]HNO31982.1 hypothetical protein [Anaerolineales bacterium]
MKTKPFLAFILLTLLALACANPLGSAPAPQAGNVETMVAATLSALTASPDSAPPATPGTVNPPSGLLPHSMYYLANDGAQITQIFRLEKDGKTATQLTFESASVEDYDVSPIDGSIAYITSGQLLLAGPDGNNRRMVLDANPQDAVNPFLTRIVSPVFSPNGQTLAFGYKGLNFFSLANGQSNRVLEDDVDTSNSFPFPRELYWPEMYSADGSKLIITLGYYEGASTAIYYTNGGALVRLNDSDDSQRAIICCGDYSLSADASQLFSASPTYGMFSAGLWRVDTASGSVTTLLSGDFEDNPADVADNPFPAPDGQLYYFYASVPNTGDMVNRPPLQLVRSGADGATNRTVLRQETFTNMNEALWAPDGSFVIVANAEVPEIYSGGRAELYYTGNNTEALWLVPFAKHMKWGP